MSVDLELGLCYLSAQDRLVFIVEDPETEELDMQTRGCYNSITLTLKLALLGTLTLTLLLTRLVNRVRVRETRRASLRVKVTENVSRVVTCLKKNYGHVPFVMLGCP